MAHMKSTAATLGGVLRASVKRWPVGAVSREKNRSSAMLSSRTWRNHCNDRSNSLPISALRALMCLQAKKETQGAILGKFLMRLPENWPDHRSTQTAERLLRGPLQGPGQFGSLATCEPTALPRTADLVNPLNPFLVVWTEGGALSG